MVMLKYIKNCNLLVLLIMCTNVLLEAHTMVFVHVLCVYQFVCMCVNAILSMYVCTVNDVVLNTHDGCDSAENF